MVEQQPNPQSGFQVLVHDDPEVELECDLLFQNAHQSGRPSGHEGVATGDAYTRARRRKLRQIGIAAKTEILAFQLGGQPADRVASWNGTVLAAVGSGVNNQVDALAVLNGKLLAAGNFNYAGTTPAILIAQWDGVAWSDMGFQPVWENVDFISGMLVQTVA